jgi:hypothetical protein
MTPEERQLLDRRRSRRNWALLSVLVALVVLFYFISIAKLGQG